MKRLIKLALFCFLFWFSICGAFAANSIAVQSLNAAASVTNGVGFAGKILGSIQTATIYLSGTPTNLSYQVQALDPITGSWVPLGAAVAITALPANQTLQFTGPYADLRVAITAYTSGNLTADIVVIY